MKAIIFTKYGPPDVIQLKEVDKPAPKDNEALVKVYTSSANPLDWHRMRGEPFLVRLSDGLLKPKVPMLGVDIAGRIEKIGKNVTEFHPGDEVFGSSGWFGGFAEYVSVPEKNLALKPANITFEEAAASPAAAITALQGLRDNGNIQSGQKILINGASGGVGTFAVQIARSLGCKVTGVCSTPNLNMVRSIGADNTIDYTQEDFTRQGQNYDLIYDAVGNRSVFDCKRALKPRGTCVITGFSSLPRFFQHLIIGPLISIIGNKKIKTQPVAKPNKKDLLFIKELLETDKIKPVIDRRYPLSETAEAIRYLEQGHARGKVIITIEQDSQT